MGPWAASLVFWRSFSSSTDYPWPSGRVQKHKLPKPLQDQECACVLSVPEALELPCSHQQPPRNALRTPVDRKHQQRARFSFQHHLRDANPERCTVLTHMQPCTYTSIPPRQRRLACRKPVPEGAGERAPTISTDPSPSYQYLSLRMTQRRHGPVRRHVMRKDNSECLRSQRGSSLAHDFAPRHLFRVYSIRFSCVLWSEPPPGLSLAPGQQQKEKWQRARVRLAAAG